MKVGFVGLGLIGSRRFDIVSRAGHEVLFAVDPDRRRWHEAKAPRCRFASTLEEVTGLRADAAFVAVPHHLALPTCRWALERAMDVLCEKPLGLDPFEATELCTLAVRQQKHLAVGFNYRFLPGVLELDALIRRGGLGQINRVRMLLAHGGRPGMESEWKLQREAAGGGALMDPGIHLLDLVRFLVGEPEVISVRLRRDFWPVAVEDTARVELNCGSVDVSVEVSLAHWLNQFQIELYGADGMATASGRGGNYGSQQVRYVNRWFWQDGNDRRQQLDLGAADPSFEAETLAFLDWSSGQAKHPALATGADGLAAAKLVAAAYAQAQMPSTSTV